MKTSELTGAALDWAAAKAEGLTYWDDDRLCFANEPHGEDFEPSTDWAQGGTIIEREKIELDTGGDYWRAVVVGKKIPVTHHSKPPCVVT
jgi:hypothetical protein